MPNADRFPGALILEDGRIFGGEPFGGGLAVSDRRYSQTSSKQREMVQGSEQKRQAPVQAGLSGARL